MGYLLRMSAEIRDWLIEFRAHDPVAAGRVGQALTALLGEGDSLGPPMVVSLAGPARPDPREALDVSYQHQLEQMQIVRRAVADAATLAQDVRAEIAELESRQEALGGRHRRAVDEGETELADQAEAELAAARNQAGELRQLLPGVVDSERKLTERSMRLQTRTDAFRTRKETLKARYTAALAELAVLQTIGAVEQEMGGPGAPADQADALAAAAKGKLREIKDEIERELRSVFPETDLAETPPEPGLLELRPGAPGDSEVRILFAAEPPGTALLIAVLEGRDPVRSEHSEAVLVASRVLRRVRAGRDPEAAECAFDDTAAFLDEFFPGEAARLRSARPRSSPGTVPGRWRNSGPVAGSPRPRSPSG